MLASSIQCIFTCTHTHSDQMDSRTFKNVAAKTICAVGVVDENALMGSPPILWKFIFLILNKPKYLKEIKFYTIVNWNAVISNNLSNPDIKNKNK